MNICNTIECNDADDMIEIMSKLFGRHPRGEPRCRIEMQNMKDRATARSKTFPAVAKAMTEQRGMRLGEHEQKNK